MVKFETSHYPCLSQWMSYYTLHENSCFSYSVYAGFFVPERVEIVTVRQLCHIDNNYWLPTIAFQNFFLQKSPGYMVEENLCMLHQVHIQSSLTKTDASWGIFLPINTFETVTIVFTCFMLKQGTQFICLHMSISLIVTVLMIFYGYEVIPYLRIRMAQKLKDLPSDFSAGSHSQLQYNPIITYFKGPL